MQRQILYFDEDPHPRDYIDDLPNSEAANIDHRLDAMCEIPPHLWPWVKHVEDKIWELKSGAHRLFYCLHQGDVVILHAIRKRRMRLDRGDIQLAQKRYEVLFDT